MKQKFLIILTIVSLFPTAVHAYAGPGVAIGAVIVVVTVVFAFFASFFITLFEFFKNLFFKKKKGSNDKSPKQIKNKKKNS
tara:strand:+ start:1853 stop:2095 length:243 start_codon:yes stop_codon:yes gene_type:complete